MKRRALLLATLAAAVAVPLALGAPPAGKGKPATTGAGCKPMVTIKLKGTVTGVAADTFTMNTTKANKHGQNFVGGGDETIKVDAKTKIRRQGAKVLSALKAGDRVDAHVRVCKASVQIDAATLAATPASHVKAHAPTP